MNYVIQSRHLHVQRNFKQGLKYVQSSIVSISIVSISIISIVLSFYF